MKVLYATMQFGRGYGQGTERYVAMLLDGLRQRGHDAVVLAGDPEARGPALPLGAVVQAEPRVLHYPARGWMSVRGLAPDVLRGALERERPDVVHVVNPAHVGIGLLEAAAALGLPVVVTVVDFWWLCPSHILLHPERGICPGAVPWRECLRCIALSDSRGAVRGLARLPGAQTTLLPILYFGRALLRGQATADIRAWTGRSARLTAALNAADAVIFLSDGARRKLGPMVRGSVQHTIPVGMESRWFEVAARRPAVRPGPRDPAGLTLGFAGALAAHKGPHVLLEALHRLGWTRTRTRLAGAGTDPRYECRLRTLAEGLNVEFVGRVPSDAMPEFLAGLDLFIAPSTWPENQPQAVLEAQAAGVPVVASRVDGIAEVIGTETMLFEPGSAAGLAVCLEGWARDPRPAGLARPVSTVDQMVKATLDVYGALHSRRTVGDRY